MMSPLVSILVPAYNAERFIAQTLRSAVDQTWLRKEILVIDDGSTDSTYEIAMQFADRGVKIVRQPNAGACTARNRLFGMAQGEYIQWLDADDLLMPDKITNQMKRRDGDGDSRTLLTSAWGSFFYRTCNAKFEPSGIWRDLSPTDWITTKFAENTWMNPTAWLVSRRLSDAAGPWETLLAASGDDDGEYIVRVVAAAREVRFVPDAVCFYRIGVSGSLNWDLGADRRRLDALCLSLKLSVEHLLKMEDTPKIRESCLAYLRGWVREFYGADEQLIDRLTSLGLELGGKIDMPVALRKYRLIEKIIGITATVALMRKWRKFKLHVEGGIDHFLLRSSRKWPWTRLPALPR